jgi:hypothetical protein
MNIEQINDEWAKDSVIDRDELATEALRGAVLHQKYLEMLMQCKQKMMKLANDFNSMKELRTRYYQGQLSVDECKEYGWAQYQGLKPLKSDMSVKLDGDTELNRLRLKLQYIEAMHTQLESILGQIKGRDWSIKNYMDFIRFQAGS